MRWSTLVLQSLWFYRRSSFALMLGATVGTAALTGALLVGSSMRGSLRDAAVGRLGRIEHALVANRLFRQALAADIAAAEELRQPARMVCPAVFLRGSAVHAAGSGRANQVNVYGVETLFWSLARQPELFSQVRLSDRSIVLNEPLATELNASVGDELLLSVGKPALVPTETLLGNREEITATLRLTVEAVVPAADIGALGLNPRQSVPFNAFVPLARLQSAINRPGRVNAILIAHADVPGVGEPNEPDARVRLLQTRITLEDLGLRIRIDERRGYAALESEAMLIEPAIEAAATLAAEELGLPSSLSLTYLANAIAKVTTESGDESSRAIPYSTVTALDSISVLHPLKAPPGGEAWQLDSGEIVLNEWAADDLMAQPGDAINLTYYRPAPFGRLETDHSVFVLRDIVPLEGAAADPGWTPPYKGVTDTENLVEWSPPFPMDFRAIREKDESYWDAYRATPKAFITLADGQQLWAKDADRFGRLTSIRLDRASDGQDLRQAAKQWEQRLLAQLDLKTVGLSFEPIRARMIRASEGTTDFGLLFIGFTSFLILAAALLVALLFRLNLDRRVGDLGLFQAIGFSPGAVYGLFLTEGAIVAALGGGIGLAGAAGYAWLMLAGLRSWWAEAVRAPFLRVHASLGAFGIGYLISLLVVVTAIVFSLRGWSRYSTRSLLGKGLTSAPPGTPRSRWRRMGPAALALAVVLSALTSTMDRVAQTLGFFASGAALLAGCILWFAGRLQSPRTAHPLRGGGFPGLARLALRNAQRHRGRSVVTMTLVSAAAFLIAALGAFRMQRPSDEQDRRSGTGGFALFAESGVPLPFDLNTPQGRESAHGQGGSEPLNNVRFTALRLRPGDESSCLNLYRPGRPRVLGVPPAMIQRGGFSFSATLAETPDEQGNSWQLLDRTFPSGAVPVFGDESTVRWQLHLELGDELTMPDDRGRSVRLRIAGLLAGSVLQDELLISESNFVRLFPSTSGYGFFLIEVQPEELTRVEAALETALRAYGFDVGRTADRLAGYMAVQNTYLSTFQLLGGLGMAFGTAGLAAVLLRNVWERRGELALMQALGFSRVAVGWLVLAENALSLVSGLAAGTLAALLALAPHIVRHAWTIPWLSLGCTLGAVLATGLGVSIIAIIPTLRGSLIRALRSE